MTATELAQLSDEALLEYARQNRPKPIWDAFFIGFLLGILIYGVFNNAWGFLALLPLFLIYLFLKKPKQYKLVQAELKKRKLPLGT